MADRPRNTRMSGDVTRSFPTDLIALGTSDEIVIWVNETGAPVKVTEVSVTPDTAVTGNTTNNLTLQAKVKTALGAAHANLTAVKTYATGTDLTAFAKDTLVMSASADDEVDEGQIVTIDKAETGTGLPLPAGVFTLKYRFI